MIRFENVLNGETTPEFVSDGRISIIISGVFGGATVQLQVDTRDGIAEWADSKSDAFTETDNTGTFYAGDNELKYRLSVAGGDGTTSLLIRITDAEEL